MNHSEVIDCVTHIKILGIGAEGCSIASHVLPHAPQVRVLSLPNQADINDEELAKILADTHLLFIATDITDSANQLNVERVVRAARARGVLVLGVAVHCARLCCTNEIQRGMTPAPDALIPQLPPQQFQAGPAG